MQCPRCRSSRVSLIRTGGVVGTAGGGVVGGAAAGAKSGAIVGGMIGGPPGLAMGAALGGRCWRTNGRCCRWHRGFNG
jgi:hypothetical protein